MTDADIDAQVAREVMGWDLLDRRAMGWGVGPNVWGTGDVDNMTKQNWQPSTDANHIREVEDEVERRGLVRAYIEALVPAVTSAGCECEDESGACERCWFAVAHATPLHRCGAALRAVRGEVQDG